MLFRYCLNNCEMDPVALTIIIRSISGGGGGSSSSSSSSLIEMANKMQLCRTIYYSIVP